MLTTIISLIFSKVGGILAAVLAFVGLWFGYKYQRNRANEAEAQVEAQQTVIEVMDHDRKTDEEIQREKDRVSSAPVTEWNLDDELQRLQKAGDAPGGSDSED